MLTVYKVQSLLYAQTSLKFRKCTLRPQRAVTCRPERFVWTIAQKAFISCTELTDLLLWTRVFTARYELNLIDNSASCNVKRVKFRMPSSFHGRGFVQWNKVHNLYILKISPKAMMHKSRALGRLSDQILHNGVWNLWIRSTIFASCHPSSP